MLPFALAGCSDVPSSAALPVKECAVEDMSYVDIDVFLKDEKLRTACEVNDDCVAYTGFCGGQDVAHKADAECLAAAHAKMGQVIDCIRVEEAPFRPACQNGRCIKGPAG